MRRPKWVWRYWRSLHRALYAQQQASYSGTECDMLTDRMSEIESIIERLGE